ncbi:MAG: aminoacyl-tRNA hydrolase [Myxococcota bacterium]
MFLVAGLGNPGPKYAGNRHNIGFMVIERLADRWSAGSFRDKFKGRFSKTRFGGDDVVLLEPLTFMNLSGESLQKAMTFFKVSLDEVVVVHDELDLGYGTSRIKVGGGTAGHNGLKSIVQQCGGNGFVRVRVGIGRPRSGATSGYVLSDFNSDERATLEDVVDSAAEMVEAVLRDGPRKAMNALHSK